METFNEEFFTSQLERLLNNFSNEVRKQTTVKSLSSLEDLDRYLYQVNYFYYQSFHDKLFPAYRQTIQAEVSRLFKLSHDEKALQKDVMANLKRYSRLYNLIKTINTYLINFQEQLHQQVLYITQESNHSNLEILYATKGMLNDTSKLEQITVSLINLLDTEEINRLQHNLIWFSLPDILGSLDLSEPREREELHRLLVYLRQSHNLAQDLSILSGPPGIFQGYLTTLIQTSQATEKKLTIPVIKRIFDQQINPFITFYIEMMQFYFGQARTESWKKAAAQLAHQFSYGIILLEIGLNMVNQWEVNLLPFITTITRLSKKKLAQVKEAATTLNDQLKETTAGISAATTPDFPYFMQKIRNTLSSSSPVFQAANRDQVIQKIGPLSSLLHQISLEITYLEFRLDLWHERNDWCCQLMDRCLELNDLVSSYVNLLANIKADLERLLAPRNISRTWKDMDVRVDRVPLERGKIFPLDYRYLTSQPVVETRVCTSKAYTILDEEGDLFIIKVGPEVEEELPRVTIAIQGDE
ncbi:hypothetical protein [Syntrophomonas erecta]